MIKNMLFALADEVERLMDLDYKSEQTKQYLNKCLNFIGWIERMLRKQIGDG